jgi:centromeric protein E
MGQARPRDPGVSFRWRAPLALSLSSNGESKLIIFIFSNIFALAPALTPATTKKTKVRDLLAPPFSSGEGATAGAGRVAAGPVLAVREDPHRGVFVDSNETIVASASDLLGVLFEGERNRSVASTEMNERSSRSHTIFRITVESRPGGKEEEEDGMEKGMRRRMKRRKEEDGDDAGGEEDDDDDVDGDDDDGDGDGDGDDGKREGPVRVSTLNLVDLAGSESVRHTGATGDRQKEGGKINRSLLTLSRAIGSLGENNSGNIGGGGASQPQRHVNFRDSKLTRILQPSLEGNAMMAVICCATPSEMYLEETRSTLQFASRAKLVKTRAQVNEIVDDSE